MWRPEWHAVRRGIPESFRKWEQKDENVDERMEVAKSIVAHPLSESQWNRGHFSVTEWESEKHKKWSMPAEGFEGHVATDGSLLGKTGKWEARDCALLQLDYDGEMGPLHGMYGSLEAELEVQHRSQKRCLQPCSQLSLLCGRMEGL